MLSNLVKWLGFLFFQGVLSTYTLALFIVINVQKSRKSKQVKKKKRNAMRNEKGTSLWTGQHGSYKPTSFVVSSRPFMHAFIESHKAKVSFNAG